MTDTASPRDFVIHLWRDGPLGVGINLHNMARLGSPVVRGFRSQLIWKWSNPTSRHAPMKYHDAW